MAAKPKRKFSELANDFGIEVGRMSNPVHLLAIMCAEAAANKLVVPEDAGEILEEFWVGRRRGKGEPMRSDPPSPVQVSKLRKFIELGNQLGSDGVENIRVLPQMCLEIYGFGASDLYNLSVKVAREALSKRRPLTERELRAIVKAERGK